MVAAPRSTAHAARPSHASLAWRTLDRARARLTVGDVEGAAGALQRVALLRPRIRNRAERERLASAAAPLRDAIPDAAQKAAILRSFARGEYPAWIVGALVQHPRAGGRRRCDPAWARGRCIVSDPYTHRLRLLSLAYAAWHGAEVDLSPEEWAAAEQMIEAIDEADAAEEGWAA